MAKTPNTPPTPPADGAAVELTAAEAAKRVFRTVPALGKDGKPTGETRQAEVGAGEVFDFAVRDGRVTVVTTDGQKLVGAL